MKHVLCDISGENLAREISAVEAATGSRMMKPCFGNQGRIEAAFRQGNGKIVVVTYKQVAAHRWNRTKSAVGFITPRSHRMIMSTEGS